MPVAIHIPIGTRYGRLVTTSEPYSVREGYAKAHRCVDVRCECGTEKRVQVECLRTGHTKSCGCLHREQGALNARAGVAALPIGTRFGRLVTTSERFNLKGKDRPYVKARCDCGREVTILAKNLTRKRGARACGCRSGGPRQCDHPKCTGKHGRSIPMAEQCPVVAEERRRWWDDPRNRPKIFAYEANRMLRRIEERIAEA